MARIDNRGGLRGSAASGGVEVGLSSKGASDFYKLSKALKAAGRTDLRKELNKTMQAAAKPLIPKVKEAAGRIPGKGGIGAYYAKKGYRAQTRTGAKTAGVRIVGTKLDPRTDTTGRIAHPIFGRKGKAANGGKNTAVQTVSGAQGFFSKTLEAETARVQADLVQAMTDFLNRTIHEGS